MPSRSRAVTSSTESPHSTSVGNRRRSSTNAVEVDRPAVAPRELRHEVRLVRHRQLRIPVEHHAQERRPGAADAEDDHGTGRRHRRSLGTDCDTSRNEATPPPCGSLPRHRRDRRACAARQPGGRRARVARRGADRLVVAAGAARAPARARAHARTALVHCVRLLLRGAPASTRRGTPRGRAPAAVREHGRARRAERAPPSPISPGWRRSARRSACSSPRSRCSRRSRASAPGARRTSSATA